jgi:ATP-binding cassette, subfamily B, multidrug efflux pump
MAVIIFMSATSSTGARRGCSSQQSSLSSMVQESVSGIRLLRAFSRERHMAVRFAGASDTYKKKLLELVRADALFMPVIALLVGLSTILTIYVGAQKVTEGTITYGVIVQFVFYVNQLTWPFASVGWVTSLVQKAEASQKRINEFLEEKPAITDQRDAVAFRNGTSYSITYHLPTGNPG